MSTNYDEAQHPRSNDGKFATKDGNRSDAGQVDAFNDAGTSRIDPDVDVESFESDSGMKLEQSQVIETTLNEFGEFTPVVDSNDERALVGYHCATDTEGNTISVTQKVAISKDEDDRWWVVHQEEQNATTRNGEEYRRELGIGNVENITYDNEDDAWASAQQCRDSLTLDYAYSNDFFEFDPESSERINDDYYHFR